MRICTVIVTHNRPELLVRCLAAVLNQTLKPEAIIVVDNSSHIPAADILYQFATKVQIFRFRQNTGGAGGFHFGLAEAFRQGFDAVWLMDDDGVPSDSCLTNLVEVVNKSMTWFSNPLVVDDNNPEKLAFGLTISGRVVSSTEAAVAAVNSHGVIEGAINPFNGALIFREAYSILGDIKFECFIWGDEEEYFERALASRVSVGTVPTARYYHAAAKSKTVQFGLGKSELKLCPPERSRFYFRNLGFLKARYRGIIVALYHGLTYFCFLVKSRQLSEAWKFVWYYIDGAFNLYLLRPSRTTLVKMLKQVAKIDPASATEAASEI
jgi:rhamnopyranosyl-N-acetylglucosaminyl-diphospho-decaprenol beta-1,3/1,4-galactofuranosyltransferase